MSIIDLNTREGAAVKNINLIQFRQERNLTQKEMYNLIKISKSYYEKIEYGILSASKNFIDKILKAFPNEKEEILKIFF